MLRRPQTLFVCEAGKSSQQMRRYTLNFLVGALALSAFGRPSFAWASTGCNALNGSLTFNGTNTVVTGNISSATFNRGDVIVAQVTGPISVSLYRSDPQSSPIVWSTTSFTYTVPSDTQDVLGIAYSDSSGPPYSLQWSCVSAAGLTNSQILEQTRQTFSKIGAQVSSQAMGDAVGGAIGDAFSGGGTTQFGNGSFRTNFAAIESAQNADAKPSGEVRDAREAFAVLGYAKASHLKTPVVQSPWHVWIDGRFTGFEDRSAVGFDGWHSNVTGGTSYRFTDNFLAGVLVGYENSNYSTAVLGAPASLRSEGVSGGGYLGWKFYDHLRLDGMLTYGRINYGAAAGAVSASFSADRITAMSKLSGRYGFGAFWLEPSAMLTIASEHQDSFIDTTAVLHNTFDFTVGRASTGGTVGVPLVWGLCVVTPTFGVFADYRFGDEAIAALSAVPTFNNGWSAHVNGGLSIAMPGNITASATAEYGGLGDNIPYWRAKGSLGVRF